MEQTEEGLAAAAATREAARRKRAAEWAAGEQEAQPKKPAAAPVQRPPCTHEVEVPAGFEEASKKLDPEMFGKLPSLSLPSAHSFSLTRELTSACHLFITIVHYTPAFLILDDNNAAMAVQRVGIAQ